MIIQECNLFLPSGPERCVFFGPDDDVVEAEGLFVDFQSIAAVASTQQLHRSSVNQSVALFHSGCMYVRFISGAGGSVNGTRIFYMKNVWPLEVGELVKIGLTLNSLGSVVGTRFSQKIHSARSFVVIGQINEMNRNGKLSPVPVLCFVKRATHVVNIGFTSDMNGQLPVQTRLNRRASYLCKVSVGSVPSTLSLLCLLAKCVINNVFCWLG